jgi:hypothetical protein
MMHATRKRPKSTSDFIHRLVDQRWKDVTRALAIPDGEVGLSYEVRDGYPHFKQKRGYAVCLHTPGSNLCHIWLSPKILKASKYRADGLIRHELGHAVDFLCDAARLNAWAAHRGVILPVTPERRADAIALAIWKEPIRYDDDLVQSTARGVMLRPEHLGL